jgi:predicted  nucleic acid-binding Zn-ribbon protein
MNLIQLKNMIDTLIKDNEQLQKRINILESEKIYSLKKDLDDLYDNIDSLETKMEKINNLETKIENLEERVGERMNLCEKCQYPHACECSNHGEYCGDEWGH